MRETIRGSTNWAEVTDKDFNDEIAAINDNISFTNQRLKWIQTELSNIYWAIRESNKIKSDVYIEGTTNKINIIEDDKK